MSDKLPTIAILGGTGDLGTGLARRWADKGYRVIIGSRTKDKADQAVVELQNVLASRGITHISAEPMDNIAAAEAAEIVVCTVPFAHQASTLESVKKQLQGKILVDVTVPLVPPKVARVQLPDEGSAGQIAQTILGEGVQVVSAFQNVAAHHLQEDNPMSCDVLVCGNSPEAREQVVKLVEATGMRGLHAGSINNAAAVEAMTSLLIFINKKYKGHSGIKITGID